MLRPASSVIFCPVCVISILQGILYNSILSVCVGRLRSGILWIFCLGQRDDASGHECLWNFSSDRCLNILYVSSHISNIAAVVKRTTNTLRISAKYDGGTLQA